MLGTEVRCLRKNRGLDFNGSSVFWQESRRLIEKTADYLRLRRANHRIDCLKAARVRLQGAHGLA